MGNKDVMCGEIFPDASLKNQTTYKCMILKVIIGGDGGIRTHAARHSAESSRIAQIALIEAHVCTILSVSADIPRDVPGVVSPVTGKRGRLGKALRVPSRFESSTTHQVLGEFMSAWNLVPVEPTPEMVSGQTMPEWCAGDCKQCKPAVKEQS